MAQGAVVDGLCARDATLALVLEHEVTTGLTHVMIGILNSPVVVVKMRISNSVALTDIYAACI
jgi:hypothetical protein